MFYSITRWWREQRAIKKRLSLISPGHTPRAIIIMLLSFAAAAAILFAVGNAFAQEVPKAIMYVITETDQLNVRERPDIHAAVEFRLERGDAVTLHKCNKYGWAYVDRAGDYGWCRVEYLADRMPGCSVLMFTVEED